MQLPPPHVSSSSASSSSPSSLSTASSPSAFAALTAPIDTTLWSKHNRTTLTEAIVLKLQRLRHQTSVRAVAAGTTLKSPTPNVMRLVMNGSLRFTVREGCVDKRCRAYKQRSYVPDELKYLDVTLLPACAFSTTPTRGKNDPQASSSSGIVAGAVPARPAAVGAIHAARVKKRRMGYKMRKIEPCPTDAALQRVYCANLCGVAYDTSAKGTQGWVKTLRRLNAHESKRCPLKRARPIEVAAEAHAVSSRANAHESLKHCPLQQQQQQRERPSKVAESQVNRSGSSAHESPKLCPQKRERPSEVVTELDVRALGGSTGSNLSDEWAQLGALAPLAAVDMADASFWGTRKQTTAGGNKKRVGAKMRKVVPSTTLAGGVSVHCCYNCGVVYDTPSRQQSVLEWTKTLRRLNAHESKRCPKRNEGKRKLALELRKQRECEQRSVAAAVGRPVAAAAAAAAAQLAHTVAHAVANGESPPAGAALYARAIASSSRMQVEDSDSSMMVRSLSGSSLSQYVEGDDGSSPRSAFAPEGIFDDIDDEELAAAVEAAQTMSLISVKAGNIEASSAVLAKGEHAWRDRPSYTWTKVPQFLSHTDFVKLPHKQIPVGTSYTITSSQDAMIYIAVEPSVRDGGLRASLPNAGFTLVPGGPQLAWGGGFQKPGSATTASFSGEMILFKKSIKAGTFVLPKTTTSRTVCSIAADFSRLDIGESLTLSPLPFPPSPLPLPLPPPSSLSQQHGARLPLFEFEDH